jgi:hypothetical protein
MAAVGSAAEIGAGGAAATTGVAAASAVAAEVAAGATAAAATWSVSSILTSAQLAWSISSTLFSIFQGANQSVTGPRLKDAHIQSAAFGSPIKRFWGVDRMAGNLIWIGSDGHGGRGIRTFKHTVGGKGKGGSSGETFTYFADFAVAINGASNCRGVIRIWAGPKLIYDHSMDASLQSLIGTGQNLEGRNAGSVTFYDGNEEQLPPALIEAFEGVGNTTAYRNQFLAVFQDFETTEYGTIPNLSFECYTDGDENYQEKGYWQMTDEGGASGSFGSWSYVDPNGEILMMVGHGSQVYTDIIPSGPNAGEYFIRAFRLLSDGSYIEEERPPAVFTDNSSPSELGGVMATGVSDEPAALFASDGKAWLVRAGKIITTIGPPQPPYDFFAKKGTDLYLMRRVPTGGKFSLIERFNADGGALIGKIADSFWTDHGGLSSINMGDDFLWALRGVNFDAFGNILAHAMLYKFDPEDMSLVQSYDLGTNKVRNFFVESDTRIRLFGNTGQTFGSALFWDWNDGEITFLGQSATPHVNSGLDGTLFVRNGIWYTGNFGTWGFYDFTVHAWAPGAEGLCCPLWKIQRDICIACGMEENEFNVTELTDCVRGFTLDQQMTGRDATLPLQRYAYYDGPESDNMLYFRKRGHNAVATILQGDCAARLDLNAALPPVQEITRSQESELPVIVHVRFKDQDASYQTGHVVSSGRLNSESKNVVTVDLAIVMTSTKAKQIAEVLSATHWLERDPRVLMLPRKYVALDAADPVNLRVAA